MARRTATRREPNTRIINKHDLIFESSLLAQDHEFSVPRHEKFLEIDVRNDRTIFSDQFREIVKTVAKRLFIGLMKKLRLYDIRLNLGKSNLLTFHSHYNALPSHLFNSQIHFPTLVRGKFLSSPRKLPLNAFTPVFFTTHIPWYIYIYPVPGRILWQMLKRLFIHPLPPPRTEAASTPPRCVTPALIFLEFAPRDSRAGYFLPRGREGAKFSSL